MPNGCEVRTRGAARMSLCSTDPHQILEAATKHHNMSGILYRGLLRRLSKWHLSSLPLPQSAGAMQGTTKGKKSVLSPDPHDDEAIREETLELAKNEMRWMLDEAQRGTTATASREQFAETAPPSVVGRKLISMVRRRVHHHEPLAYILG